MVSRHSSNTDYRLGRIDLDGGNNIVSSASSFHVHLDNKVTLTGSYDAGNNWTTWTLPLAWSTDKPFKVIRGTGFASLQGREVLNTTRPSTTTIRAAGNHSAASCIVGSPYDMTYRFSRFYMRDESGQAIDDGRTSCKSILMQIKDTGYLKAHVSRQGQADRTYETGAGVGSSLVGVTLKTGDFRVPLYTSNKNLGLKVTSDSPYPVFITKAQVIIDYNNNDRSN